MPISCYILAYIYSICIPLELHEQRKHSTKALRKKEAFDVQLRCSECYFDKLESSYWRQNSP